jgi:phage shock protein PspC (stress-responsive transcriptional regulator)
MANSLLMNNPKVKLLLLISLLAALGAVLSAFAAGSRFQFGFNDGAFNYDFKVATGDSRAASVLGFIALATGLVGLSLHVSGGNQAGSEAASVPGPAGSSEFSDFPNTLRRLTKSKTDVWLGGVCGGLGEHTPLPSWVWRLVFLLLLCWYGTGVLLYILLWIFLPEPRNEAGRPGISSGTVACAVE